MILTPDEFRATKTALMDAMDIVGHKSPKYAVLVRVVGKVDAEYKAQCERSFEAMRECCERGCGE